MVKRSFSFENLSDYTEPILLEELDLDKNIPEEVGE